MSAANTDIEDQDETSMESNFCRQAYNSKENIIQAVLNYLWSAGCSFVVQFSFTSRSKRSSKFIPHSCLIGAYIAKKVYGRQNNDSVRAFF
ncbi:uncharacterized protein PHALS_08740 [Plasmopara halstedii]|uniref:Uncharacterized protein n=1 Tax=Plasmopara halstedii TaxID=4781 RepID=A0A0P1ADK4_PLAHL|nr:uncharacterized protein PHALS_08740 [Plasmopara halstedii]CEG38680.1 hypothetical protein PHALS_08740 [Plasmopara halstedii]|eukprot:XP_024575049.1 hypothetical protein PHALS_08740 [Plasmopara halstedii]